MNVTKGPGDLYTGPDEDPAYGLDDADAAIAAKLVEADEVAELICEVREALPMLDWIARNVTLPDHLLRYFRALDRRAHRLDEQASAELATLNAPSEQPDDED